MRELGKQRYAVKGTPTDCVIMGVRFLLKDKPPDLVLSGVNRGQNLADDVNYSGTVAGAIEGVLLGVPSIALSLAIGNYETGKPILGHAHAPWRRSCSASCSRRAGRGRGAQRQFSGLPARCRQGHGGDLAGQRHPDLLRIEDRLDTRGKPYYWVGIERRKSKPPKGTDLWAVQSGPHLGDAATSTSPTMRRARRSPRRSAE